MREPSDFDHPTIFFDDLSIGRVFELGSYTLTEHEIVSFSTTWAPHPSHTDATWSATAFFGGIVAPVSLTHAASARLLTLNLLPTLAFTAGREVVLEPRAPVRPDRPITVRATVTELNPSRRPDHGYVTFTCESTDPDDTIVLVARVRLLVARRPNDQKQLSVLRSRVEGWLRGGAVGYR